MLSRPPRVPLALSDADRAQAIRKQMLRSAAKNERKSATRHHDVPTDHLLTDFDSFYRSVVSRQVREDKNMIRKKYANCTELGEGEKDPALLPVDQSEIHTLPQPSLEDPDEEDAGTHQGFVSVLPATTYAASLLNSNMLPSQRTDLQPASSQGFVNWSDQTVGVQEPNVNGNYEEEPTTVAAEPFGQAAYLTQPQFGAGLSINVPSNVLREGRAESLEDLAQRGVNQYRVSQQANILGRSKAKRVQSSGLTRHGLYTGKQSNISRAMANRDQLNRASQAKLSKEQLLGRMLTDDEKFRSHILRGHLEKVTVTTEKKAGARQSLPSSLRKSAFASQAFHGNLGAEQLYREQGATTSAQLLPTKVAPSAAQLLNSSGENDFLELATTHTSAFNIAPASGGGRGPLNPNATQPQLGQIGMPHDDSQLPDGLPALNQTAAVGQGTDYLDQSELLVQSTGYMARQNQRRQARSQQKGARKAQAYKAARRGVNVEYDHVFKSLDFKNEGTFSGQAMAQVRPRPMTGANLGNRQHLSKTRSKQLGWAFSAPDHPMLINSSGQMAVSSGRAVHPTASSPGYSSGQLVSFPAPDGAGRITSKSSKLNVSASLSSHLQAPPKTQIPVIDEYYESQNALELVGAIKFTAEFERQKERIARFHALKGVCKEEQSRIGGQMEQLFAQGQLLEPNAQMAILKSLEDYMVMMKEYFSAEADIRFVFQERQQTVQDLLTVSNSYDIELLKNKGVPLMLKLRLLTTRLVLSVRTWKEMLQRATATFSTEDALCDQQIGKVVRAKNKRENTQRIKGLRASSRQPSRASLAPAENRVASVRPTLMNQDLFQEEKKRGSPSCVLCAVLGCKTLQKQGGLLLRKISCFTTDYQLFFVKHLARAQSDIRRLAEAYVDEPSFAFSPDEMTKFVALYRMLKPSRKAEREMRAAQEYLENHICDLKVELKAQPREIVFKFDLAGVESTGVVAEEREIVWNYSGLERQDRFKMMYKSLQGLPTRPTEPDRDPTEPDQQSFVQLPKEAKSSDEPSLEQMPSKVPIDDLLANGSELTIPHTAVQQSQAAISALEVPGSKPMDLITEQPSQPHSVMQNFTLQQDLSQNENARTEAVQPHELSKHEMLTDEDPVEEAASTNARPDLACEAVIDEPEAVSSAQQQPTEALSGERMNSGWPTMAEHEVKQSIDHQTVKAEFSQGIQLFGQNEQEVRDSMTHMERRPGNAAIEQSVVVRESTSNTRQDCDSQRFGSMANTGVLVSGSSALARPALGGSVQGDLPEVAAVEAPMLIKDSNVMASQQLLPRTGQIEDPSIQSDRPESEMALARHSDSQPHDMVQCGETSLDQTPLMPLTTKLELSQLEATQKTDFAGLQGCLGSDMRPGGSQARGSMDSQASIKDNMTEVPVTNAFPSIVAGLPQKSCGSNFTEKSPADFVNQASIKVQGDEIEEHPIDSQWEETEQAETEENRAQAAFEYSSRESLVPVELEREDSQGQPAL